jgi:hypothetical protein
MAKAPKPTSDATAPQDSDATAPQDFIARIQVFAAAGAAAPGQAISLTRDEYDALKPLGAIEGDWANEPAGQPDLKNGS